ncbi:tetratricopeptide repeat protein [Azospirillum sp. A26]|uniref:tetratricopeptide repeat protein n=1 Tax=Azospirillum sp. A26 TaxID=3160607 RepID=UPI00366FEEFF
MSFTEKLLDAILGTLPKAALALIPEHRKKWALERLQDFDPFAIIADNHDLIRVLRVAWIDAAEHVLDAGRKAARSPEWTDLQRADIDRFHGLAIAQLRAIRDATFDRRTAPGTTAIDRHLPLVVRGAAETVSLGMADRYGEAGAVTAGFAATLAALVAGGDVGEVPPIVVRIAAEGVAQLGGCDRRSFGDLVFASFAETLKDPTKYPQATTGFHMATQGVAQELARKTLAALESVNSGLPAILAGLDTLNLLAGDAAKTMHRIDGYAKRTEEKVDEILAMLHGKGTLLQAVAQGIPEAAIRAILKRIGGEDLDRDDLIPWLDNWIETASRELGRHSNEDKTFEAARRKAEGCFLAGQLKEASSAFMEELAREEREEAGRQEKRRRRQVRLLEEAVRFDELALDGEAAAAKLRKMAVIEGANSQNALGKWLFNKAEEYYERGHRRGENAALLVAVAVYRTTLLEYTRASTLLQWAMTQNNLGSALSRLGEREAGTSRLKEAVIAFRTALDALEKPASKRERFQWAKTQNNLGAALSVLGAREAGTSRLKEAVATFRVVLDALEDRPREHNPLQWAMTQNNLGTALSKLGEREAGTSRLEEAVVVFRSALKERSRKRAPLQWAMTQNNLGNVLCMLDEREAGTGRLKEAVVAYQAALEEYSREDAPLQWATMQSNLGTALSTLGRREGETDLLEEAVVAFRSALEERTRKRSPLDWAMTQNNLGTALQTLGEREGRAELLEEAIAAYCAALEEYTCEQAPLDWAMSLGNQGVTLMLLAEKRRDPAIARRALNQIEHAYNFFRDVEHAHANYYEAQLPKAKELVGHLLEAAGR